MKFDTGLMWFLAGAALFGFGGGTCYLIYDGTAPFFVEGAMVMLSLTILWCWVWVTCEIVRENKFLYNLIMKKWKER